MNFNLGNIVQMANAIRNPKQAINMLLNKFGEKNPQVANSIRSAINSGKNPKEFIMEQARSGNITLENLNQLKGYYNMAQKLGLYKKIPNSVWAEAESAIKNGTAPQNTASNKFSGF